MRKEESHARRAGFTMVEVIVVMGIIAILVAVMMPMLSGNRDSSLAAQCKNNMRNLAQGVLSRAQANYYGHFPSAGHYRYIDGVNVSAKKPIYAPHRPWISNKGNVWKLNSRLTDDRYTGNVVSFADSEEDTRTAITNGAIWHAVGTAYEVYRCPVHASNFKKKNGRLPGWSYMMNQEFGYDANGSGARGFVSRCFSANIGSHSPDKVLLFAEVQGAKVEDKDHGIVLDPVLNRDLTKSDAVLKYNEEDMGFTHPLGKGRYGGNVAFADGHVDTITMPTDKNYIKKLTRYLCQGYDVPHDGSKPSKLPDE